MIYKLIRNCIEIYQRLAISDLYHIRKANVGHYWNVEKNVFGIQEVQNGVTRQQRNESCCEWL